MIRHFDDILISALQIILTFILICIGIFLVGILGLKFLGKRIEHPLFKYVVDFLGVNYLDNSEMGIKLREIIKVFDKNLSINKLILLTGKQDFNFAALEKYSMSYLNQDNMKLMSTNSNTCFYISHNTFLGKEFLSIAKMIKYHRNQVPLNALVLNFNLSQLGEITSDDLNNISKQIQFFNGYQNYPVYLLLDNISSIDGFGSLNLDKNSILGSTLDIESQKKDGYMFSDNIANQIIKNIVDFINQASDLSLLQNPADVSQIINFVANMQQALEKDLARMIKDLFYKNTNIFLRGVYLCDSNNNAFCTNLFLKLIFIDNLVKSKNFSIRSFLVRNLFVLILFLIVLALPLIDYQLKKESVLVNLSLNNLMNLDSEQNYRNLLKQMMQNIAKLKHKLSPSILLPISWFHNFDEKLENLAIESYRRIFLNRLYVKQMELIKDIVSIDYKSVYSKEALNDTIFGSISFLNVYYFVDSVLSLEETEMIMTNLSRDSSIEDLNKVVKNIFKFDLPKEYFDYPEYFSKAFDSKLHRVTKLNTYQSALEMRFLEKFDTFIEQYQQFAGFFNLIDLIKANLEALKNDGGQYSVNQTQEIHRLLKELQKYDLSWINSLQYSESDYQSDQTNLATLMYRLNKSKSFNEDFINKIKDKLSLERNKLKNNLVSVDLPVIGKLIDDKLNFNLWLIPIIDELNENSLLLPVTKQFNGNRSNLDSCAWNTGLIQELRVIIDRFNIKIKPNADKLNTQTKSYVTRMIANILRDKFSNDLCIALQDTNLSFAQNTSLLDFRLNNLNENFQNLNLISDFAFQNQLGDLAFQINTVLINQYEKLLSDLYSTIDLQGIYVLNPNSLVNESVDLKFIETFVENSKTQLSYLFDKAKPCLQNLKLLYNKTKVNKIDIYDKWLEIQTFFDLTADTSLEDLKLFFTKLLNCKDMKSLNEFYLINQNLQQVGLIGSRKKGAVNMVKAKLDVYLSQAIAELYTKIKLAFDTHLKEYFPFAPYTNSDAPRDKILAFYEIWLRYKDEILNVLQAFKGELQITEKPNYQFLLSLSKAMRWVEHIIKPQEYPASATIKVRDNQNFENLVDQVINWKIRFDGQNSFTLNHQNQLIDPVIGNIGDTINLKFLIYTNIDMVQQLSPASQYSFMKLDAPLVNGFSYSSDFALLRLIMMNFDKEANGNIYLKFKFPLKNKNVSADLVSYTSIKLEGVEYFDVNKLQ